jgi:hypothetical protein
MPDVRHCDRPRCRQKARLDRLPSLSYINVVGPTKGYGSSLWFCSWRCVQMMAVIKDKQHKDFAKRWDKRKRERLRKAGVKRGTTSKALTEQ